MSMPAAAAIRAARVIAIVRESAPEAARAEAARLLACGVTVIEVSLTTPGALDVISWLDRTQRAPGRFFGVGTALTATDAEQARAAGAEFLVSPISTPELIATARRLQMTSVMGALTPTECYEAATLGADFVKLFPANLWTPAGLRGLLQALPTLPLVPTGGVTLETAAAWLSAGAVALGLGGALRGRPAEDLRARLAALADGPAAGAPRPGPARPGDA